MTRSLSVGVYGARGVPSTYSGYETFLSTMLPQLVERGHDVTMYCRRSDGFEPTDWQGVHRRVLPDLSGKTTSTLSHGLLAALAARRARHDVVLVVNVANAAYCAIGRFTGQPTVLNTDGQEWKRGKWGRLARSVFRGSAHLSRWSATALVSDCQAMADIYVEQFRAPSTVIPYCVPISTPVHDRSRIEALDLVPRNYLLTGGRLVPENNIDRITEEFVASDLDIDLVVLGKANYDSPVGRRLGDLAAADPRVRILGHVDDRATFLDLLHFSSLYLHGHSVGGLNPSLIEAMGAEARVCALDTDFNREALGTTGDTFVLEPPDVVKRIRFALEDSPESDRELRAAARRRAIDWFSIEAVTDAYEQLLVAAADGHPVPVPTRWNGP